MRRRRYRLPLLTVGSLLAPLLVVALPAGAAHAAEPTAVFHKDQDWDTGYGGSYTITNAGSTAINGWTLSAFLPADPAKIAAGIDVPGLFGAFDFATVQGYDYHGARETTTNQQSALKVAAGDPSTPERQFSSEIAINAYLDGGAPKSRPTPGVPFYGRGWTGVPRGTTNGLFQTATGPAPGSYENGFEDYYKLKEKLASGGHTLYRDPVADHAYIYNGTVLANGLK
ncbi:glycosyl hydrolase family 18 protein [Kitasatospora phosalacinea]|uniref:chitinase n=1 Tax=Kitasatospora phosalacinea TaxID=2065 RepID=A0A9W6PQH2_9ACTN|nr:glycosyl hydrolase family 18 protein [Kitasatospora phosalacinea]GLW59402.1 hypothetical protein Kpho01_74120 [Kitasatospora phosalacinea]